MVELVPSILSADFSKLGLEIEAAERGGGSVIHIDIMDGHFVPNLTMGPPVVKSLRKITHRPLDCHLMIENPVDFIPEFGEAGADLLVAGSAVFDSGHPEKEARTLLKMAQEAEQRRQGLTLSK
jgi:pentose-5-phosphate-3-epimerase